MARNRFTPGKVYAARVLSARRRPLENQRVMLVRIEFEAFLCEGEEFMRSTGKIASRDIALTAGLDADPGVQPYLAALRVENSERWESWVALNDSRPWVKVEFGEQQPHDQRNSMERIFPLDVSGWQIVEYTCDLGKTWVRVHEVGEDLGLSEATIRRRVNELEVEWGAKLVRRTKGNQRLIHLPLLRNLLAEVR